MARLALYLRNLDPIKAAADAIVGTVMALHIWRPKADRAFRREREEAGAHLQQLKRLNRDERSELGGIPDAHRGDPGAPSPDD